MRILPSPRGLARVSVVLSALIRIAAAVPAEGGDLIPTTRVPDIDTFMQIG